MQKECITSLCITSEAFPIAPMDWHFQDLKNAINTNEAEIMIKTCHNYSFQVFAAQ